MLNLFAASINISPLSCAETIFQQGGDQRIENNKVSFCFKIAKHLHQLEMLNASRVFAYSLFIESKRESGSEPPAFDDLRIYCITKIIHFLTCFS